MLDICKHTLTNQIRLCKDSGNLTRPKNTTLTLRIEVHLSALHASSYLCKQASHTHTFKQTYRVLQSQESVLCNASGWNGGIRVDGRQIASMVQVLADTKFPPNQQLETATVEVCRTYMCCQTSLSKAGSPRLCNQG